MKLIIYTSALMLIGSCDTDSGKTPPPQPALQASLINKNGQTIQERFGLPEGYYRTATDGYGDYLRTLPLLPDGSKVSYYNGDKKLKPGVYESVVKMDIGNKDLQQCADAVMRLRAEYLYKSGQADKIHFHFTNGFDAAYSQWKSGKRIAVNGNKVSWVRSGKAGDSYQSFRGYMDVMFSYAGTLSLSRELMAVPINEMKIGDVLIQGGSPGHAVIVVDMATNRMGGKLYMLAQSYMPAQDIQILCNPANKDISPWYELDSETSSIITPEWDFTKNDLKRFP
jgi:hypothetical protein